jgi:hypothetical protein
VDKRIQEDNLQHLALFSEYGRMALAQKDPVQVLCEYVLYAVVAVRTICTCCCHRLLCCSHVCCGMQLWRAERQQHPLITIT